MKTDVTEEEKINFLSETRLHVLQVQGNINTLLVEIVKRSSDHDVSKFSPEEAIPFAKTTPRLKETAYGSEDYRALLGELKPALDHHYANNSHHPEHYEDGINGMCLIDILEMFCDWLAAVERHDDGDIFRSIEINKDRFGMPEELCNIFRNTLKYYYKWKKMT